MSAALVRKALEFSEETAGPLEKSLKNSGKRKLKSIEKKKKNKLSPEELLKKNLKILKALEFSSRAKKYGKAPDKVPTATKRKPKSQPKPVVDEEDEDLSRKSKRRKKNKKGVEKVDNSVFTEEDFASFEREYFVTN